MSDHSLALQQAIYGALVADGTLMGMVTGVFDRAPDGQPCPYVALGEDTVVDASDKLQDGQRHTLNLHVWSRPNPGQAGDARGRKQAKDILARLHALLHRQNIAVTGAILVLLRFEFEETLLDQDGITFHGIARYRALTHDI